MKRATLHAFFVAVVFLCAASSRAQLATSDCLGCHGDTMKKFSASVHGPLDCVACHTDVTAVPHEPKPAKPQCVTCHADQQTAQDLSVHGKAIAAGNKNAATCLSCHGPVHEILPSADPQSRTYHTNIPKTCGSCHSLKFVMESAGLSPQPLFSYGESVHGKAVARGSLKAAVCTDCHDHHEILSPRDQRSPINKFNIPNTCGHCHVSVAAEYRMSIHGKAIARGISQAPVCTDCHGIHNIKSHIDPNSSVAAQQIARTTCGQCHGNVKITQELGVAGGRLTTYQDSYHGLAKRLGSKVAANCASCHGVHNILPSSDPKSTVNKANLGRTCGKCHPNAGAKFIVGKIHLEESPTGNETGEILIRWIRRIYIALIFLTIGSMLLHNALIWWKKANAARKDKNRVIERMNANQRIQHVILLVSFTVLVISGFALAYPESILAWLLGSDEGLRRIVHRVAAVVMLALGTYHVVYMLATREGRKGIRDFWFRFKDGKDLIGNLKYYSGLSNEHPKIARFGYAEKAEYWAMIWGTIVMGVTGFMLWYKDDVVRFLQRWWVDVALTVHFYEAVLATLAVIVWHFYHVIFDPDIYPVSWTWLDGKVTPKFYEHEHGQAYEEWKKEHGGDANAPGEE
jgi:cytochrome b subunit of formate dehydrogenase